MLQYLLIFLSSDTTSTCTRCKWQRQKQRYNNYSHIFWIYIVFITFIFALSPQMNALRRRGTTFFWIVQIFDQNNTISISRIEEKCVNNKSTDRKPSALFYTEICVFEKNEVPLQPNEKEQLHIYRFIPANADIGIIGCVLRFRLDFASSSYQHCQ